MKTKSLVKTWPDRMKTFVAYAVILCAALVRFAPARAANVETADWLLEKGIYTEETKGELKAAVALYQQIVDDPKAPRSLVAQAQLRLGLCELKLGNKPRALSALER